MPVGVEEELEEPRLQIVMVGDIASGGLRRHRAGDPLPRRAEGRQRRDMRRGQAAKAVPLQKGNEVEDGALLDHQPPVHEHLAEF